MFIQLALVIAMLAVVVYLSLKFTAVVDPYRNN